MKNKSKISLVLALLMIVSTFAVGTVNSEQCDTPTSGGGPAGGGGDATPEENLEVVKKIWNGTNWVDEYTAEVGEIVQYKITVTYTEVCGYKATNIKVEDYLEPDVGLSYVITDVNPAASESGDTIVWNLTEDYGTELFDEDSVEITYNLTITKCDGCGQLALTNTVEVYALETCCQGQLYGDDEAKLIVECEEPCEPGIEVVKKVWNGTDWADYVDDLHLGDMVDFKIVITYDDCDSGYELLNMEVVDELPCCLIYDETTAESSISTTGEMDDPTEEVTADGKVVFWNWTYDRHIVLHGGDTLTIKFTAEFANYCEGEDENCVYVQAWGCSGPTFRGSDCATVDCTPPETKFDKKVKDGKCWVDEITTTVGDTLRFKLSIVYYGNEEYSILRFKDVLPCILEYADNAMAYVKKDGELIDSMEIEGDLQPDNKTVWFNLTYVENFTLEDGVEISVEFDATVTGLTECGCECEFDALNKAWLYLFVCGTEEPVEGFYDEVEIHSEGNCPPYSLGLYDGPSEGKTGVKLEYTTSVEDPDEDQVYFMIDWDDGTSKVWDGLYDSGEEVSVDHTFATEGVYKVKVKAKDEHGLESEWTSTIVVKITKEEEPPEEGLQISIPKMFSLKNVAASVKNIGTDPATDIDWTFNITKSGLLFGFDIGGNGTIATLAGGATSTIMSGNVTMRLGMAEINIVASAGGKDYNYTGSCLVLGRIVLVM